MDARRLAPALGIVACLLVLVVLLVPYALVDSETTVGFYYANGAINPLIGGLLCAVGVIVFAAGRQRRTDPVIAAGLAVAFGSFVAAVAVVWALTVPENLVLQLSTAALLEYHRAALAAVSLSVFAVGVWYVRALSIV